MKTKLSTPFLAIAFSLSSTIALVSLTNEASASEISSTTDVIVSQTDCVVSEQEISIVGGAVGGTVGGVGGAVVGSMIGGRTGGWIGGLVGGAVGGSVGSKGRSTYDCSVVVDNGDTPTLVRSVTHKEVKKGDTVQLHTLTDGTFHISNK